jgi:hypothetical protein
MNGSSTISPMLQLTISKMNGDMKFVGIFYIIIGAFYCLTIIGAVIGIPLIISGLRVREAADSFGTYLNSNDAAFLERGFEKQGSFFFIQKVFMIIALVLIVLYIIFIIAFGLAMFNSFHGGEFTLR